VHLARVATSEEVDQLAGGIVTGRWAAVIAARLLREETYRLMAAPAIADLQFEKPRRGGLRWATSRLTVWSVIARAAVDDLRGDLALAFGRPALRAAWAPAVSCYIVLVVVLVWRSLARGIRVHYPHDAPGTYTRLPLPSAGDGLEPYVAGVLVGICLACVSYAMAVAVFRFRRRGSSRAALAAALLIAVAAVTAARLSRPIANARDLYGAAIATRGLTDPKGAQPLADVIASEIIPQRSRVRVQGGRKVTMSQELAERRAVFEIAAGVNVLAFALVGFTLAGIRGWRLAVRGACMTAAWVLLTWALPIIHLILWPYGYGSPQPTMAVASLPAFFVVPLIACVSLAIRPYTKRAA
jgi:hypothetical protein